MGKINREPKIMEVPLPFEERSKIGCTLMFFIIMAIIVITLLTLQTKDYRFTLLLIFCCSVIGYHFGKNLIFDFIKPTKLIVEGLITWKREHSYIEQRGRFRMEEYAWKYWIYLGSIKLEINESEFKKYQEGDLIRVEKAKRSNIIYSIHLLKKKEEQ